MTGALVCLRGPLKTLAGGGELEIEGATVGELLRALEREKPPLDGWILDERDRIRRHINVFVNGERGGEDTPAAEGARGDVLPPTSRGRVCRSCSWAPRRACSSSTARTATTP